MIVIKVGGSLYELRDLRERLHLFLGTLKGQFCIVPGGGPVVEAIREWDQRHALGDESAHWLAVEGMNVAGCMLTQLLGLDPMSILNARSFLREHDELPHSWTVTSDSIAAMVALKINAERLILLKSITIPHDRDWQAAARQGWVDDYFPIIASRLRCPIECVNLRHFNVCESNDGD